MGIGIICIAGFMVGLPSKSEKKLHVSYSRDKMHRRDRQQWNISSVRFLQQDDRTARRSERFVYDNGGISSKPIDLPCNPKGLDLAAAAGACGQREWSP